MNFINYVRQIFILKLKVMILILPKEWLDPVHRAASPDEGR